MNKLIIIGNLTSDPKMGYTPNQTPVCNFTIAVNERRSGEDKTQYFRVTAWRKLGESCAQYLSKGKKVFVSGSIGYSTYRRSDGDTGVNLEVTAEDIEFLSPRGEGNASHQTADHDAVEGIFTTVDTLDELPF